MQTPSGFGSQGLRNVTVGQPHGPRAWKGLLFGWWVDFVVSYMCITFALYAKFQVSNKPDGHFMPTRGNSPTL